MRALATLKKLLFLMLLPATSFAAGICGSGTLATTYNPYTNKQDYVCNGFSGGSGSPGGNPLSIQFNDGGSFGGNDNFQFDKSVSTVSLVGNIGIFNSDRSKSIRTYFLPDGPPFSVGDYGFFSLAPFAALGSVANFRIVTSTQDMVSSLPPSYSIFSLTAPKSGIDGTIAFYTKNNGVLLNPFSITGSSLSITGPIRDGSFSTGSSGQVYTSNGAGSAPTWGTASGGGGGVTGSTVSITMPFDLGSVVGSTRCTSLSFGVTISSWAIVSDSGTFTMHVTSATLLNYQTSSGVTTIMAATANSPSLTTQYANSATVSSWSSTVLNAGDLICGVPDSLSGLTWANAVFWGIR